METPQQTLARIRNQRKYHQPSAIGNSLFMLLVRYTSLAGFFILAGAGIYIYASAGKLSTEKANEIERAIAAFKELVHLKIEDSKDQGFHLMIFALLFLVVYKLTSMVLRRNTYIFMINEVLDGE